MGGDSAEEETMLLDVKLSRPLLFCVIGAAVCTPGIGASSRYLEEEPPRVHPLFQLSDRAASPFPSDIFTVVDAAQATGRRVNLPYPDCAGRPSDCDDIEYLNALDGFGLTTRISIPFDGAIDPTTVSDHNVFVISRSSTLTGGAPGGEVMGINQVVWDPATHTLHVEVNEILDQYRQYALIVTDSIHDELGRRIKPSTEFKRFHQDTPADYRARLEDAIAAAKTLLGIPEGDIAVASVFTTLSLTPVLERIRDDIKSQSPPPATFALGPSGERAVYSRASVSGIVLIQQNRVSPPGFINATFPLADLDVVQGAVGTIAHGSYQSPIYIERPAAIIPAVGTRAGVPPVRTYDTIYFTAFVPSGPRPAGGWPVMITSGLGYRHQGTPALAAAWASRGIATMSIAAEGYGFGPLGSLRTNFTDGTSLTIPDAGRSYDQDGNNLLATDEGASAAGDRQWTVGASDTLKQTVIDLLQLVRVIEIGMDVDGDGSADIDPSRISFHGQSAGGRHGTMLAALDPSVSLVTFSGCCATTEYARWNVNQRSALGRQLAARVPSLINADGLTSIDGVPVAPPHYNENKPLRNRPTVVNMVAGAIEIQEALETREWAQLAATNSSLSWLPYLTVRPLAGNSPKTVAVYVFKGDQVAVNPSASEAMINSDLLSNTLYYRHDLAFAQDPTIPKNPHMLIFAPNSPNALVRAVSRGMQAQMADFHASGGAVVNTPTPKEFWEVPIVSPLDHLSFIR
jgi:hypothetical protein